MSRWDDAVKRLADHVATLARDMSPEPACDGLSTEQTRRDLDRAILRAAHAVAAGRETRP